MRVGPRPTWADGIFDQSQSILCGGRWSNVAQAVEGKCVSKRDDVPDKHQGKVRRQVPEKDLKRRFPAQQKCDHDESELAEIEPTDISPFPCGVGQGAADSH